MKYKSFLISIVLLSLFSANFVYAGEIGLYAKMYHNQDVLENEANNIINNGSNIVGTSATITTTTETEVSGIKIDNPQVSLDLDLTITEQGQTVKVFNDKMQLILGPGVITEPTSLDFVRLEEDMAYPWNLHKLSSVYQFDLVNDSAYSGQYFTVQLSYDQPNNDHKQIFYYDNSTNSWRALPSKDYPGELYIQATITLPYARLAVFSHPGVLTVGRASWYAYQGGDFAASPDFPKGSIIRVTNIENGRFLDVTINDWGPERDKFPDRAIDLDKLAFAQLASLGAGVIDVMLQPLYIAPDSQGEVLGVKETGMSHEPSLTVRSAVIMDDNKQILLNKNGQEVLPLASLTKLVSVYTYLSTMPNLFKTVEYKYADEQLTYAYCKPWESAKVTLNEGDQVLAKDLVYSALVGSANNAVESLVRASGLSRDEFITRMNSNVASWGAQQTKFIEPTGLSPQNVSTAQDYAIIIKEVMTNLTIAKASITSEYKFTTLNTKEEHRLRNTNKLVSSQVNIVGSKTGYLNEAGYCLATKIKSNDKTFYIVTLNASSRDTSFSEMTDLISYSLNNL